MAMQRVSVCLPRAAAASVRSARAVVLRSHVLPSTAPAAFKSKRAKKGAVYIKPRKAFTYYPDEALKLLRICSTVAFDESIDIAVQLGVDPRRAGEMIRGVAQLPHGTGKTVRVAVFATGDKAEEARQAGADVVGAEDLVERVQAGELDFDKAIAAPNTMQFVGRIARILGPRGMMPNPKMGTVTMDIAEAVTNAKRGQVSFRVEKNGILHSPLGRMSFADDAILANLRALMLAVNALKPDGLKGDYFRHATISTSMGPGVPLEVSAIDPTRPRFGHTAEAYRDPKDDLGALLRIDAKAILAEDQT